MCVQIHHVCREAKSFYQDYPVLLTYKDFQNNSRPNISSNVLLIIHQLSGFIIRFRLFYCSVGQFGQTFTFDINLIIPFTHLYPKTYFALSTHRCRSSCCTSADSANRRPATSSIVPTAWIQGCRSRQSDRNPLWCAYSHRGRQCSPLTTHTPRGVRNPDSKDKDLAHTAPGAPGTDCLPSAMMARIRRGLLLKLLFHCSPLVWWLHTNTHHSTEDTSQPH